MPTVPSSRQILYNAVTGQNLHFFCTCHLTRLASSSMETRHQVRYATVYCTPLFSFPFLNLVLSYFCSLAQENSMLTHLETVTKQRHCLIVFQTSRANCNRLCLRVHLRNPSALWSTWKVSQTHSSSCLRLSHVFFHCYSFLPEYCIERGRMETLQEMREGWLGLSTPTLAALVQRTIFLASYKYRTLTKMLTWHQNYYTACLRPTHTVLPRCGQHCIGAIYVFDADMPNISTFIRSWSSP